MAEIKHSAEEVVEAIRGSSGIKSLIAKRLKLHRNSIDNYLKRYATAREAYDNEVEVVGDLAESVIIQAIKNSDVDTAKWYAKIKLKSRGYADNNEQSLGEITIRVKYGDERTDGSAKEAPSETA